MRNWAGTTLLVATLALTLPGVSRADIKRNGAGAVETIECRGESVQVSGAANDLTLLGDCPLVEVYGAGNTVRIEQARKIEVAGFDNEVVWQRGPGGRQPDVESRGASNSVRQGQVRSATAPAAETGAGSSQPEASGTQLQRARKTAVLISDDGRTETIECAGNDVTIDGNLNKITLTGECRSVDVNGNGNAVQVAAAAAISSLGDGNTVTWYRGVAGKDPRVSNLGNGNSVSRASE
jgi:hypothetical protein